MKLLLNLSVVVALATFVPSVLGDEDGLRKLQVFPSPTPSPTYGAGASGSASCISGDSRVQVAGRGLVDLKDVRVDDEIMTSKDHYQRIYALGHYNPNEESEFLYVETQVPLEPLKLTPDHLVFVEGKDHPVRAASLSVGDVLVRPKDQAMAPSGISSIRPYVGLGTYTPLTDDATLLVDGVMVSSYISLQSDQDEFVEFPFVGTSWKWTHQDYVHWTLAPFRLFCGSVSSDLCQVLSTGGIPYYIDYGIGAVQWAHHQGGIIEVLFLIVALTLFAACRLVEVTVGVKSLGPLVFVAAATHVYWKKQAVTKKVV